VLPDLVGFEVLGRHGMLGVVIDVTAPGPGREPELRIRGGISDGLLYVVPLPRIRRVAPQRREVDVDVAIDDFSPSLRPDGSIELHLTPR